MIVLPFPPSVNHAYPSRKNGGRFKSKAYNIWLHSCPKLFHSMIDKPVHIDYRFYFPDKRIRDCSNYIKVIEDYLVNSGVLTDDNWHIIESFTVKAMGIDKQNPRVEVIIDPIGIYDARGKDIKLSEVWKKE